MNVRVYKHPKSPCWYMDLRQYGGSRVSTKRTRKAEALEVATTEAKRLMDRKQLGRTEDITLGAAFERLIGTLRAGQYRRSVIDSARRICGEWDGPQLEASMMMSDLTTAVVSKWRDERLAHDVAARSVGNDIRILRRVYNLCLKEWDIPVNPMVVFKSPPAFTRRRRLVADEEARLLAELDPHRKMAGVPDTGPRRDQIVDVYDLTVTLIDTGMRVSEACNLRWNDISLQEDLIVVFRQKTSTESVIGITPRLKDILVRRRAGSDRHVYVFPRWEPGFKVNPMKPRSGPFSARAISRAIERAGLNDDAELVARSGKFTIHSFRDTFASRLIERGLSKRGAQDLMGHSTSYMVDKYTHLETRETARKAALLLAEGAP